MRVLLIEDDDETATFIQRGLMEVGAAVERFPAAPEALSRANETVFDVAVIDRMLPMMEGLDAVRLLRARHIATPVLMLTALSSIEDRVRGLEAGADDYLTKPFAFSELLARLRALVRRPALAREATVLRVADLELHRPSRSVRRGGRALDLSPREYRILECLMLHEGDVVTRTMLLETVWGLNFDPKTSLVQTHLSRLRSKVDKPFGTDLIRTVRGAGYVIAAP